MSVTLHPSSKETYLAKPLTSLLAMVTAAGLVRAVEPSEVPGASVPAPGSLQLLTARSRETDCRAGWLLSEKWREQFWVRVPGSCLWGAGERRAACGRSTGQSRAPHLAGQGEG